MIRVASAAILLTAFIGLIAPSAARQFSADLVDTAGTERAKIVVDGGKVRLDVRDVSSGYFLVDTLAGTAYLLRPRQQLFMDARQSSVLTAIFVPVDPRDPCDDWRRMEILSGEIRHGDEWHCDRIGRDTINGHSAIKYRLKSMAGKPRYCWVDPTLGFPVRFQSDGTAIDLTHVRSDPPPAGLFAIPPDFRRFEPQRLIDRIKQSDVWVETPR